MTYRVLGEGPPLVLIPGIASTYRVYALLLNTLAERFRTILYDYPGEQPNDGASLGAIRHGHLTEDLLGLIDHLNLGQIFLVGLSFGSTVALRALHREPHRFPRAVLQGAFAHRRFSASERLALRLGRLVPGKLASLPLRQTVLTYNARSDFPTLLEDRWQVYLEENGKTPIRSMAHRVDELGRLDLRPILAEIGAEILLLQGNEDRIVPQSYFEELKRALPRAQGVLMPTVGHQPHLTHAEALAQAVGQWLLPDVSVGCTQGSGASGCPAGPGEGGCGGLDHCLGQHLTGPCGGPELCTGQASGGCVPGADASGSDQEGCGRLADEAARG
jgi:pimeloyl-ACP methyl ester carboxylesterase